MPHIKTILASAAALLLTPALTLAAGNLPDDLPTLDDLLGPLNPEPTPALPQLPLEDLESENNNQPPSSQQQAQLFNEAIDDMNMAARRLGRRLDPGDQTQQLQQEAIDKLTELIRAAQQSSSASSSQPQPRPQQAQGGQPGQATPMPGQPQPGSTPALANPSQGAYSPSSVGPESATPKPIEELRREWGNLPPRIRAELSESLSEPFSPSHRQQTEAYFRTLADLEAQTSNNP
ncbi:hypothetical protein [Mucisphaera sp.]|uniref:hypothetical protein n=1 Tax=Mucisphaera sp. TaxID=2913024 RepID=UPI003D09CBFF